MAYAEKCLQAFLCNLKAQKDLKNYKLNAAAIVTFHLDNVIASKKNHCPCEKRCWVANSPYTCKCISSNSVNF